MLGMSDNEKVQVHNALGSRKRYLNGKSLYREAESEESRMSARLLPAGAGGRTVF